MSRPQPPIVAIWASSSTDALRATALSDLRKLGSEAGSTAATGSAGRATDHEGVAVKGIAVLAAVAAVAALAYAGLCAWRPLGACRRCDGAGTRPARPLPFGPRWLRRMFTLPPSPCRRCKGAGRRVRIGRRAFDAVGRLRTAGTRHDERAAKP